jgi:hypothetical protein
VQTLLAFLLGLACYLGTGAIIDHARFVNLHSFYWKDLPYQICGLGFVLVAMRFFFNRARKSQNRTNASEHQV